MLNVAHVMEVYLPQSATFIWQYIHSFKNVRPVIIAGNLINLDQFLLPNGRLYAVPLSRWSSSWIKDNFYRRLKGLNCGYKEKILRRERIDLIHAHFGPTGFYHLDLAATLKIPLITTFYGYDLFIKNVIQQKKSDYARLFKEGDYFLIEGPFEREQLIALGCPEEKIRIQRIAIDLEKYTFRPPSWDGKRPIRLLFIGRFVEKKGLEYALRALAQIRKNRAFEFRIIGGGKLEESLKRLAADLGFGEEIVWLGMQSHKRVIEEMQSCDILVQPSVTATDGDSEGGSLTVIIEAQACGLPVIATTTADIPDTTIQNESALLSPERDIESLAKNIKHLLERPDIWAQMGSRGRKHMEIFHDVRKEVEALENLYTTAIDKTIKIKINR